MPVEVYNRLEWSRYALASCLTTDEQTRDNVGAISHFVSCPDDEKFGVEPCKSVCIVGAIMIDCGAAQTNFTSPDMERSYFGTFVKTLREYVVFYAQQYFTDRWIEHYDKEYYGSMRLKERGYWMNLESWNDDDRRTLDDITAFLGEFESDSQYRMLRKLLLWDDDENLRELHAQANRLGDFDNSHGEERVEILNQIFNMSVPHESHNVNGNPLIGIHPDVWNGAVNNIVGL
tara:strand:- start:88 stop:783 length:696 start_codon:yes stop_codon:yes gene_type:complete